MTHFTLTAARRTLGCALTACLLVTKADAVPLYWDANGAMEGAGSAPTGTWGTDSYWNTDPTGGAGTFGSITTATDDLYFSAGPSSNSGNSPYTVTVSGTQSANSLTFQSSAQLAPTNGGTTLTGGTINLGSGGIMASQYAFGTTGRGSVSIESNIALQASSTFTNNRINNEYSLWIKGVISDGAGSFGIVKAGVGTMHLFGNNTFDGGVSLDAGRLVLRHANALGTGTLTINGGALSIADTVTINNNAQVWAGDFLVGTYGGNQRIGNGSVTLTGDRTVSIDGSQNFIVGGAIGDSGSGYDLNKSGTGTMTLDGANTYSGNTVVNAGTLVLSDNASLLFEIGANGINNQINGVGTLTLNGDFVFDLTTAGIGLGDSWTIVTTGTLSETFGTTFSVVDFTEAATGVWERNIGGITYQFSESTGALQVSAIPEPSAMLLLAAGLMLLVLKRRSRSHSHSA